MTKIEKLLALINGMIGGRGGVSQAEQVTIDTRQLVTFSHHLFTVL